MTQQTATQWLEEQIKAFNPKMNTKEEYEWMFRQAFDIEKEQIIDAYINNQGEEVWDAAHDYYNETYKK